LTFHLPQDIDLNIDLTLIYLSFNTLLIIPLLDSVATAIADVFRNNGISVGRNLAKILKIFEKIDDAKSRGVI
jgi:hypothetical protein